jgi:3-dehydroquinate dehydratase type I
MSEIGSKPSSYEDMIAVMKATPLICTPITTDSYDSFIADSKLAKSMGSDFAEFRIDYFPDIAPDIISDIIKKSELPLIVTNRNRENGGLFAGGEDSRLQLLYFALESKPLFIDIELAIDKDKRDDIIKRAKQADVGVICSYHDFRRTPTLEEILKIYSDIAESGANLAKIVLTPVTNEDTNRILSVTHKFDNPNLPFTIFGMGPKGQNSRLLAPLFGSCLIYSSLHDDPNNKLGQVSLHVTRTFFNMMNVKGWSTMRNKRDALLDLAAIEFDEDGRNPFSSIDQLLK